MAKDAKLVDVIAENPHELLRYMDRVVLETAYLVGDQSIATNIHIELENMEIDVDIFLEAWKEVFDIVGATMTWKRRYVVFGDYIVDVKNTDPITARNFIKACFIALQEEV